MAKTALPTPRQYDHHVNARNFHIAMIHLEAMREAIELIEATIADAIEAGHHDEARQLARLRDRIIEHG